MGREPAGVSTVARSIRLAVWRMTDGGTGMQKSLEVEYWVIDDEGALAEPGPLAEVSDDGHREFVEPLLELKTPPCETCSDLRAALVEGLTEVLDRADDLGKGLVPLGTPIDGDAIERWPGERGRIQARVLGEDFGYAKHCAGTHLHVEQRNVVDQLNVLIGLDPALALVNSSPYFRGERIADGARAYLYRKQCYEQFPDHGQLWDYVDTVAQWERRLDRRFDEFREAAVEAGVEAAAVDEHFSPDDVVWTPVRLREAMPTVEWRSPDVTLPSQTLRLAEEVIAMMELLHDRTVRVAGETGGVTEDELVLPEFEVVGDLAEDAMLEGVGSTAVADYLGRMGFDVAGYEPSSRSLRAEWGDRVGPAAAREIRLRYAERLERDVAGLRRAA